MRRRRLTIPAALAVLFLLAAPDAGAIPAFARKYQISCTTCHAPFPRLKEYGEEFAARGFRMPPAEEPARATYDVGDPLLRLPRDLPLAARIEGFAVYNQDDPAEESAEWPSVFKVLSGGPISERFAYYLYFIVEDGEVVGLEDAYVQYNGLLKAPIDVILGQFQVSDPLFKRELRLERFDYQIYKVRVGSAQVNLTYDRGVTLSWHAPWKIEVVAEVVNGNGIDDPYADFDRDRHKNPALRIARRFGPVRVGLFGYDGREKDPNGSANRTIYAGPDLVWDIAEKWQLNVQYLERRDSDPFYGDPNQPLAKPHEDYLTRGGFAELHFFPGGEDGRWALSALYNRIDSDDPAADFETASLTLNYLLARNARLLVEGGRDVEHGLTRGSLGLVVAF